MAVVVSRRPRLDDAEMATGRALGSQTRTKDPVHLRVQLIVGELVWIETLHAASVPGPSCQPPVAIHRHSDCMGPSEIYDLSGTRPATSVSEARIGLK